MGLHRSFTRLHELLGGPGGPVPIEDVVQLFTAATRRERRAVVDVEQQVFDRLVDTQWELQAQGLDAAWPETVAIVLEHYQGPRPSDPRPRPPRPARLGDVANDAQAVSQTREKARREARGDPHTADDLQGEALLRYVLRYDDSRGEPGALLNRVLRRLAIDEHRRRKRRPPFEPMSEAEHVPVPSEVEVSVLGRVVFQEALATLAELRAGQSLGPEGCRNLLWLMAQGATQEDISQELGITVGQVRYLQHQLRRQLRPRWAKR